MIIALSLDGEEYLRSADAQCAGKPGPGFQLASEFTTEILEMKNALFAPVLHMLKFQKLAADFSSEVLQHARDFCHHLISTVSVLAQKIGIAKPLQFIQRFHIDLLPHLFEPGWLEKHLPVQRQRVRALERISDATRLLFRWVRDAFRKLEGIPVPDEFREIIPVPAVPDEFREIIPGPAVKDFMLVCKRQLGVLSFLDAEERAQTFQFSPEANKAWGVVRLVLETPDPSGAAALPPRFQGLFNNHDKEGNIVNDDLHRFLSYIHPVPNRPGFYRFARFPKPGHQKG